MEKIESIRNGSIWLNVFKTHAGQIIVTVNKTYRRDGQWHQTPFLNTKRGDIIDLKDCLNEFHEFEKVIKSGGAK